MLLHRMRINRRDFSRPCPLGVAVLFLVSTFIAISSGSIVANVGISYARHAQYNPFIAGR
jgi:hypothetical protein